MAWTTLAHHIDVAWLTEAFRQTRRTGAPGVDGVTWKEYAADLEGNLRTLLERFKSGRYRAPPVRRAHVPKGDGRSRPIGIPTLEDKVLQRAVKMLLEPIYEQDFHPGSYGFRPERSAHQAVTALRNTLVKMGGGWVLEVDIQSFFDTLDHKALGDFLDKRVRDGVVRRTIGKWLNAGVMEEGVVRHPETGTPQGGVISPLLANIYLHEVLDRWFEGEVVPRMKGAAHLVRYADDFVLVFESEVDARRVWKVLPQRFARFGLTLHPEKTRLVPFERPRFPPGKRRPADLPKAGTFDLLGFTFQWSTAVGGYWTIRTTTAPTRLSRAVHNINQWCRRNRHAPVEWQRDKLASKLRGHAQYYGRPGNEAALRAFRFQVVRAWRKWLNRRSQKARMTWDRMKLLMRRHPLPYVNTEPRTAANP